MPKLENALKNINRDDVDFKQLAYSSYSKGPVTITETTITRSVPDERNGDVQDAHERISDFLNTDHEMSDDPAHRTEVRTVTVTDDDDDGGTVTTVTTTTTVTRDGETMETTTETREGEDTSDPDKEKLIKEMFAGDKGVMDFFNDDDQKPETDETEI